MALNLPKAVQRYVVAENGHDADALADCFSADATVTDEARTYRGRAAIKAWKQETTRKYQHRIEPLASEQKGNGITVTSRLSGNFPGSPISVKFTFTLVGDDIASLVVGG